MAGVAAAALGGIKIGEAIANGTLKYEKKLYEDKITEMEGYRTQLNAHFDKLQALKARISTFCNDSNGEKMTRTIEKASEKVQASSERVDKVITACKNSIEILEQNKMQASESLEKAIGLLDGISDL